MNEYIIPTGLLNMDGDDDSNIVVDKSAAINSVLDYSGKPATIVSVTNKNGVVTYALEPARGVRVQKIKSLEQDFAVALENGNISLQIPIPGTSFIGIQVPVTCDNTVLLGDLIDKRTTETESSISFSIGKRTDGTIASFDFKKTPHFLVAGTTGAGKTMFICASIISLLYKNSPSDMRFIMVDTHGVSLGCFSNLPHLLIPIVTDVRKASATLNWILYESKDRFKKFALLGVREIDKYNEYCEANGMAKLPRIVLVIDDFADLMQSSEAKNIEDSVCRIAQTARAAGIHMLISTQRPSVNVLTGIIKANIPNRVAFRMAAGVDSRTVLDMNGAECLSKVGEFLFKTVGANQPEKIQGAYITDEEIWNVVSYVKELYSTCSINDFLLEQSTTSTNVEKNLDEDDLDPLLFSAGLKIIETQKASIGLLQRTFKIGFNRAVRIMDELEKLGVVGHEEGTKLRDILYSSGQLEEYRQLFDK